MAQSVPERTWHLADRLAIAAIVLLSIELLIVVGVRGRVPFGSAGLAGFVFAIVLGVPGAILALRGRFGSFARNIVRVMVLAVVLLAVKVFRDRWPDGPAQRLHAEAAIGDTALMRLDQDHRLRWAARVAAHAISTGGRSGSLLRIPQHWAFPSGTEIRVTAASDSLVVSAKDSSADRACQFAVFSRAASRSGRHEPIRCGAAAPVMPLPRLDIRREDWARVRLASATTPASDEGAWRQYRRDAARSGELRTRKPITTSWRVPLDGEVRSTPSVVGNTVLIGTHGPGVLHTFELDSGHPRWSRYLPNWIHQDAVSDGATVVVGFGDNTSSLIGEAPSGVSAFSLATGELLWTAFEGNSVMASALVRGSDAVYVTSAGVMKVRDLTSGTERGRLHLPGRATMAPPALVGDTLIASLDTAYVCAIRVRPLERLWCTNLPGVGMMGHSAPSVADGLVYVSGGVFKTTGRFGMSGWRWFWTKSTLGWVGRNARDFEYDGQQVWALDVATGRIRWQSRIYPSVRGPTGHSSGTMVVQDGVAAVLLPLAGVMVAFDPPTGRELWTQDIGASRGPASHAGGRWILSLNSGELRVVQAGTGAIDCSIPTGAVFDRAGPAIADSTLLLGLQKGILVALPLDALTKCDADQVRSLIQ